MTLLEQLITIFSKQKSSKENNQIKQERKNITNQEQPIRLSEDVLYLMDESSKLIYFQKIKDDSKVKEIIDKLKTNNQLSIDSLTNKYLQNEEFVSSEEKVDLFVKKYQKKNIFWRDNFSIDFNKYSIPPSGKIIDLVINKIKKHITRTCCTGNTGGRNYGALQVIYEGQYINTILDKIPKKLSLNKFKKFYNELLQEEDYHNALWLTKVYSGLNNKTVEAFSKLALNSIHYNIEYTQQFADFLEIKIPKKLKNKITEREIKQEFEKKSADIEFFESYSIKDIKKIIPKDQLIDKAKKTISQLVGNKNYFETSRYFSTYNQLISIVKNELNKKEIAEYERKTIENIFDKNPYRDEAISSLITEFKKYAFLSGNKIDSEVSKVANKFFNYDKNQTRNISFAERFNLPLYKRRYIAIKTLNENIKTRRFRTDFIKIAETYCSEEKANEMKMFYEIFHE